MKPSITAVLTISFASITALAAEDSKFVGCISAIDGKCLKCFKRLVVPNQEGCGPLLPETETCIINTASSQRHNECSFCKEGYYQMTDHGSKITTKCLRGFMTDCVSGYILRQISNCMICSNGMYPIKGPVMGRFVCEKVKTPVPNCLWGFRSLPEKLRCARCSPGFSVDLLSGGCVAEPQKGCWISRNKICTICDPYLDYSMDGTGKCFKNQPAQLIRQQ